ETSRSRCRTAAAAAATGQLLRRHRWRGSPPSPSCYDGGAAATWLVAEGGLVHQLLRAKLEDGAHRLHEALRRSQRLVTEVVHHRPIDRQTELLPIIEATAPLRLPLEHREPPARLAQEDT